jgi:hypothetical protein
MSCLTDNKNKNISVIRYFYIIKALCGQMPAYAQFKAVTKTPALSGVI